MNDQDGSTPDRTPDAPTPDTPRVFLSSTYLDNVQRRKRILVAVERAGCFPIAMERWSADDREAQVKCLTEVASADVFVGVLAWKYGWIPSEEECSITELEYRAAVDAGKPRLMFVIDQPLDDVKVAVEFDGGRDRWKLQQKLDEFKDCVKQGGSTWYPFGEDVEALATDVMQSLFEWRLRQKGERDTAPTLPPPSEFDEELIDYFGHLQHQHGHITLAGFETRLRIPLRFDELYVPLDVARHEHNADKHLETEPAAVTLAETLAGLFAASGRLAAVLLGHPGSGKTTQLRRVALRIAQQGAGSLGLPDDVIPVLLPLRQLRPGDASLKAFFQRLVGDDDLDFGAPFVKWLWDQRLLLLLDGLDEVPRDRRGRVRGWVERCATGKRRHRALISCRFEGYRGDARFDDPRFVTLELRPLSNERRNQLVTSWYRAVEAAVTEEQGGGAAEERQARTRADAAASDLVERLQKRRATRLYEFASNPLLLTAICLVHRDRGSHLPERRAVLYDECVKGLLELWREQKKLAGGVTFEAAQARRVLQPLALWMHGEEGRARATAAELEAVAEPALRSAKFPDTVTAESFLATIRDESGLLTGWSGDEFGFLHLGFQEYLAAQELRQQIFALADRPERFQARVAEVAARVGQSWWHEVLCMLFADEGPSLFEPVFRVLVRTGAFAVPASRVGDMVRDALHFSEAPFLELLALDPKEGLWKQRLAALGILAAHGSVEFRQRVDPEPYRKIARSRRAPREAREGAEAVLSALGVETGRPARTPAEARAAEPPTTVVAPRGGYVLQPIPGGSFLMGSPEDEEDRLHREGPQHEVEVPAFFLGIHPVTNDEYARYLQDRSGAREPKYWGDSRYNEPNQPVVGVSFEEASLYCEWAGLVLPTEAQWEYACRGRTTTRFWSGNADSDLERVGWVAANSEIRLHAVGEKPANDFGLVDMHGNVWEWCLDSLADYSQASKVHPAAHIDETAPNRVIRGGSFGRTAWYARSACRLYAPPELRRDSLGFRPARVIT